MPEGPGVYGGWPSSGEIGDNDHDMILMMVMIKNGEGDYDMIAWDLRRVAQFWRDW